MFIDIHAHAYWQECPPADGRTRFAAPGEVIRRYDELGIERGALLPLIGPETYLPQSNEDILRMCADSGGRLFPFFNIDPRGMTNAPDAPLDIWMRHYIDRGCRGLGEIMPNLPFLDPRCQNLFKHAEAAGLPLVFDISHVLGTGYGFYDDPGLPQLEQTLRNFPRLNILGHGPAFWAEIARLETPADRGGYPRYPVMEEGVAVKLFRRYRNLWGDLSAGSGFNALARDRAHAARFLDEFQDRLLFGTDICTAAQELPLAGFLKELKAARLLSETAFAKIAREHAVRLLNLPETPLAGKRTGSA